MGDLLCGFRSCPPALPHMHRSRAGDGFRERYPKPLTHGNPLKLCVECLRPATSLATETCRAKKCFPRVSMLCRYIACSDWTIYIHPAHQLHPGCTHKVRKFFLNTEEC